MKLEHTLDISERIRSEVRKATVGQSQALDIFLIALLCDGHILFEGPPGTAKTLMAQSFATSVALDFGRIQFTPDLMPGDILGTYVFHRNTGTFEFIRGPIFTQVLLADEINRTPPKTQAALLQAMQERIVTIDGKSHRLPAGFIVIATQNPVEHQGTYPLPEAQLDRFLFKHLIDYPTRDQEVEIVLRYGNLTMMPRVDEQGVTPVIDLERLTQLRHVISEVRLHEELVGYVVDLVRRTREHTALQVGASPRAANMLAAAARANAALRGRDYVVPDDVKELAYPTLRHRLVLAPTAQLDDLSPDDIITEILEQLPVPR